MTLPARRLVILFLSVMMTSGTRLSAQTVEWSHTFGGSGNENAYDVQQSSDGGYIVGGKSFGGFYVVKLTSDGSVEWTRTYDLGNGTTMAREVQGGYLLAGFKKIGGLGQQASFAKISTSGDTIWTRLYGGYFDEQVNAAVPAADGGCFGAGQNIKGAFAMTYLMACRIGPNGDSLWMRTFSGSGGDNAYDVETTFDNGCVIAGSYANSTNDGYLVRLDSLGNILWMKMYGTTTDDEKAYCVVQTPEGGFLAVIVSPYGGVLYKLDQYGDTSWTKPLPFGAYRIRPVSGGRYILAGQRNSDAALALIDSLADTLWTRSYGGTLSEDARSAQEASDGGFIFVGTTTSFGAGGADFYVVKTDSTGATTSVLDAAGTLPTCVRLWQNFPNPFNPTTVVRYQLSVASNVRLVVYDILGREIAILVNEAKAPGTYDVEFNGTGLASGLYFYRLTAGTVTETKPLILLR